MAILLIVNVSCVPLRGVFENKNKSKSLKVNTLEGSDTTKIDEIKVLESTDSSVDSTLVKVVSIDSLVNPTLMTEESIDSSLVEVDSTKTNKPLLDDIITGTGQDSLVFDVKSSTVYMYEQGVVDFQNLGITADYIRMDMKENLIEAKGVEKEVSADSLGSSQGSAEKSITSKKETNLLDSIIYSKASFKDGETTYDLDSFLYNIESKKAKLYGLSFKEGEGILRGKDIKMMDDDVFNIRGGTYSTCDAENPHFYLKMSKAQFVQNGDSKKIIMGPTNLVFADVSIPFLGFPFAFFPMIGDKNSGVILPEVGEENTKGFYVRDFGYYFAFNDYLDLTARAGIYTLGSWQASIASTYRVRYKFNGNFGFEFNKDKLGTEGSADFQDMNNYRLRWTHTQDAKFNPGSSFAANVNFSSSSFNKYDATNMEDYTSAQTNSSVSYSKNWAGSPFSLSTNVQHSQNNRDSTVLLSMPNTVFNVSRFSPFQRKNASGKQKWYEKITLSYTNTFNNSVTTKEDQLFKKEMFDNMKYGMKHDIPINTSFNILKYLNISPSASYSERWYFNKISKVWNPETEQVEIADTTNGFNRVYDYRFSAGLTTKLYGMFTFTGEDPLIKAIRHVMTPSVSFSYTPNFGDAKYGFYEPIQTNANGNIGYYSPFEQGIYGVPGRSETASMSFSLGNNLEMKVRSESDTTGYKKVKILENLSISSSYNFLADSMNLAPFSVSARTTLFKTLGINVNATFDPYALNEDGQRINVFSIKKGKLVRLTNLGFSFGYSFRSFFGSSGEDSGTGSETLSRQPTVEEQEYFVRNGISYAEQQRFLMNQTYYNFSVPWNLSFNYNFSYSKSGLKANLNQTLSFNGSVNITKKMGITFNSGYDFSAKAITPGNISLTRDLHCWQMSFNWVPVGFRKSWNFKIAVNSQMLQDLKYEKSSSFLDNYDSYY